MKFAHFADCHIGSWRDQKLRDLSVKAFAKAVDECIKERVDFIIIAGDFFNTALPPLDNLKEVVKKLKELKDKNIPIYGVTGSHDYSASGKTMIDVIEHAGLFRNVFRGSVNEGKLKLNFTIDEKTSAKITGIKGRKGLLDKKYYEALEKGNLESEKGFKIFIFHTAIEELKPKELDRMDSAPLSYLPKNFDYYAGGHVHYIFYEKIPDYGIVAYPGALFPVNFAEIEKYSLGGYYLVNADKKNNIIKAEWRPIKILNTYSIKVDCNNKNPRQVENEIKEVIKDKEFVNTIVTIRLFGVLESGKPSDINFKEIFDILEGKSAYFVMKSTTMLESKEFKEIKADIKDESVDTIEDSVIEMHAGQSALEPQKEKMLVKSLMKALCAERGEGERVVDFEKRIKEEVFKILNIE